MVLVSFMDPTIEPGKIEGQMHKPASIPLTPQYLSLHTSGVKSSAVSFIFLFRLLDNIDQSSLCYTVGPLLVVHFIFQTLNFLFCVGV